MSTSILEERLEAWLADGLEAWLTDAGTAPIRQQRATPQVELHLPARVVRILSVADTSCADLDAAASSPAETASGEPTASPSISRLRSVCRDRADRDADLLLSVIDIVDACRERVLGLRGWHGTELNRTQTRSWTAETKRAAITEVQAAAGFTTAEATTLVSLAMTAGDLQEVVIGALRRGETSWPQLRKFWDCAGSPARGLSQDQRLLVALSLFGTDEGLATPERLDPEGGLELGSPWPHASFEAALTREVTACEGSDVSAEREKRRRAHQQRRARVRVHDDGTATLILTGPAVPLVGVWSRFDNIARSLRAEGADSSLDQLAVDAMLTVLAHGRVDLPDPGTLDELPQEELDHLIAVVNGAPRIALQVVVPVDALGLGHPICANCAAVLDEQHDPTTSTPPSPAPSPPEPSPPVASPPTASPPTASPPAARENAPGRADGQTADTLNAIPDPAGQDLTEHDPTGHDPTLRHGRGLVGEVLGSHPFFITPGHARELFFYPGTTLHRIVTDPADGRCLERTIATYRPDADMRRQVHAADVYSRAPWARLTGRSLEIDHVIPYGTAPGGVTGELNLADLDKRNHQSKTIGQLAVVINDRRDLTFTTLLGQITRTRVHDYRQYLHTAHPEDLDDRRDLAAQAVYAALAARPEHRRRPGRDTWLTLDHTDPQGQRHPGPPERPADLDSILGIPHDDDPHDDTKHWDGRQPT